MKKLNPKNYPQLLKLLLAFFYVSTHVGQFATGTRPTVC